MFILSKLSLYASLLLIPTASLASDMGHGHVNRGHGDISRRAEGHVDLHRRASNAKATYYDIETGNA